jgi:hypothetical protein
LSPFAIRAKVLLQELWRIGVTWDEEIEESLLKRWQDWQDDLLNLSKVIIPRCYQLSLLQQPIEFQLHHFSDASRVAYASVSFLRMSDEAGNIHCAFLIGKSRNAPLRDWSIPRLELQAAVLSCRLHRLIEDELDLTISSTYFWSDSMTTLQYIKNTKRRFQVFVANRLNEIHDVSSPSQWNHVPGPVNPADDGSRGMNIPAMLSSGRWWHGPEFLWKDKEYWPISHVGDVPDNDKEIRSTKQVSVLVSGSPLLRFLERYSSWSKLQIMMAWLLRFLQYVSNPHHQVKPSSISITELHEAAVHIVRLVQMHHFHEEVETLQSPKSNVLARSKLATLNPILMDGVIRVGGRLKHAPISYEAKHPMILPNNDHVSTLIIRHYHEILGHAGREHVLSFVRQRYWILGARILTRRILRNCLTCRKRSEAAMQQIMADLPKERLVPYEPPFTYTGVDFFGPFFVKRGRSSVKVYACIFVCFNSRAIHIEDVSSLETDTFIQALRRFISNRGSPKRIWSDNGTNFRGAEKELRLSIQNWNQESIKTAMRSKEIEWEMRPISQWQFQTPVASHMSGVWERLIRSVRKSMKAVIGHPNAYVTKETLRTIFAEVVTILNSRPLCASSDDPNDFEALTPSHFLLQRQNVALPPGHFTNHDLNCRKQWRRAQFLVNCYWKRWIKEYLPLLQSRQKWRREKRNLRKNDLVLVADKGTPRGKWSLARVTRVFPGRDGRVRTVEVKTKDTTFIRPITTLCLLEESSND